MKRIGIYGGSFNPIHIGHISLAKSLLSEASLDEIWFMVSPQNPLKQRDGLLNDQQRFDMVKLALQDEPRLVACNYEFHLPQPSYTLNTLHALAADYPEDSFSLLIGGDNWAVFDKWRGYDEIIAHYPIIIYPREGSVIDARQLPSTVRLVDTPLLNISSTEIRNRVAQGLSITGMVPASIEQMVVRLYAGVGK